MPIRESTKKDLDKVIGMRVQLWKFEKSIADFTIKIPTEQVIKDEFTSYYENNEYKIFVAEYEGDIVGFIYGNIEKSSDYINDYDNTGYIESLYVLESFRGKDIGSSLIKEMLEWFSTRDVKFLQLGVLASNTGAIELYKKYGFEVFYCKMKRV